jgi:caa(3)-type oxidase subunit IV
MSEPVSAPAASHAAAVARPSHAAHYVKVWAVLLGLLVVSVLGPFLDIRVVTLLTAFGVAGVKAYLVAKNFMHVNLERRFIVYMMGAMGAIMLVMLGGFAPDIFKHDGRNWENVAAKAEVARGEKAAAAGEGEHQAPGQPAPAHETPGH